MDLHVEDDPITRSWVSIRDNRLALVVLVALGLLISLRGRQDALGIGVELLVATVTVGILPGVLVTLLWRPRASLTVFELLGCGLAVSLGLAHLLTVLMISAHIGVGPVLTALLLASSVGAVWLYRRPTTGGTIEVCAEEVVVAIPLLILAGFLYVQGSPVESFDDQFHAAIVRRLAFLDHPASNNFFFGPGIVYTYPIPSTHAFMALVAKAGDIDPLFVYHKLRFFWGLASILLLYLAARLVFGARGVACAVALTAIALAGSGVFAVVPETFWAQLVPYSHPSDVAQGVLLPLVLVMALSFLHADALRERSLFFSATLMMAFMLTVVHIREVVQLLMYLGCFSLVALVFRVHTDYMRRALVLIAAIIAIVVVYVNVYNADVVTDLVRDQRERLMTIARAMSLRDLLFTPAHERLAEFFLGTVAPTPLSMFHGVNAFILLSGPMVIIVFRQQPLVWLMSSSILAYLLIMNVPLLAIPYIYSTYYEILFMPVRNVSLFIYLLAGAIVYVAVAALTRLRRTRLVAALLIGAGAGLLSLLASLCLNRSEFGFFAPVIAAYTLTFVVVNLRHVSVWPRAIGIGVCVVVSGLALVALLPESPGDTRVARVNVRWADPVDDGQRSNLERRFQLADGAGTPDRVEGIDVWEYSLRDTSIDNVRALVTDPAVADTHHINRDTFEVDTQAPHADDPILGVEYVSWLQYPGIRLSTATAVLVWVIGFVLPFTLVRLQRWTEGLSASAISQPFHRHAVPYVMFLVPFALWSAQPSLSPVMGSPMPPFGFATTPQAMMDQVECVTRNDVRAPFTGADFGTPVMILPRLVSCPPSYALMQWMHANVPVNAVLAMDRWNEYLPSVFMPQQVVAFPGYEREFFDEQALFRDYYNYYDRSVQEHRAQPFFNALETAEERRAFLQALQVTHVLVDPPYYETMRAILDQLPQDFDLKYSDGEWAVYEVTSASSPTDDRSTGA